MIKSYLTRYWPLLTAVVLAAIIVMEIDLLSRKKETKDLPPVPRETVHYDTVRVNGNTQDAINKFDSLSNLP